jgi:uncharacterized membrane protein
VAEDDTQMEETDEQNGSEAVGGADENGGLMSQLLRKEVLIPVGASAASAGVAWAVKKGGGLGELVDKVKDVAGDAGDKTASKVADKGTEKAKEQMEESGGVSGMAAKAMPGGDEEGEDAEHEEGRADPDTRRLPIQRWTDVAAPVETVFECWTDFDEYPEFMHRVLSVEHDEDDDVVKWSEKIWFWTREWEAEITEMVPNERIAWKTKSGTQHHGVVTFHRLDDKLTRVLVTVDFHPTGMFEKMASGMRFVKRAVQSDLARFKAYVELEVQKEAEEGSKGRSQDKEGRKQSRGKESQGSRNGSEQKRDGSSPQAKQDDSDDDAEAEREERAARREKRREKAAA